MRVLVAMSGGVDSSVAAALLQAQGHEVVGATMKLWGGRSDSGCCSVADVLDARRVADRLGIEHHTFSLTEAFEESVVAPYVAGHAAGRTPNPCVECNRHLKFDRFLERALRLGFDAVATGHHARVERDAGGQVRLLRGADRQKDQSYVLAVLERAQLQRSLFPVGTMTKPEVRRMAERLGLSTAAKPDSQDVCFVARHGEGSGRKGFLAPRVELHPGRVVEASTGAVVGQVDAVELVTVGQRRGLGPNGAASGARRYALEVDVANRTVLVGGEEELLVRRHPLEQRTWVGDALALGTEVLVQSSAHGQTRRAVLEEGGVRLLDPARAVAPGQLVACYVGDQVVGSGIVAAQGAAAGISASPAG
ncbi:MAG: tRNA (5-methylaminomethyl-2-thiouridylate)-methyltransferase [Acidimicrobiaceae bacterium]|nr:tRNA (5-methylaminomethyl-2-thiouridylate)-methyltransferase [Acidimicrobiaceae bacterium]